MNNMIYLFIDAYFTNIDALGHTINGLSKYTLHFIPKYFRIYTCCAYRWLNILQNVVEIQIRIKMITRRAISRMFIPVGYYIIILNHLIIF